MADNTDTTINCPACGKPMKKIFMPSQGINLDVCVDGCGGIYFDNREFSKFDEPHEDISALEEVLKGKEFKKVDENVIRVCPVCGADMVKNHTGINKETIIDECYHCGGKFLDYGELGKVREEYNTETERTSDAIIYLYKEVGTELLDRPGINKYKNQAKGKVIGLILGLIIAGIWLTNKSNIIFNPEPDKIAFNIVIAIAIAIVCLFTGFGSLFGRIFK